MGACCNSKENIINIPPIVEITNKDIITYSLQNYHSFKTNINFNNFPPEPSTFLFNLYDVICINLVSPSNIFAIVIKFPDDKNYFDCSLGKNCKFHLNVDLELNLKYEELFNNYMDIEIYTINEKIDINEKKFNTNKYYNENKNKFIKYSHIKFDLLTLIMSTQSFDVSLSGPNNTKRGRICFKLKSFFVNNVEYKFKNFRILFNKELENKIGEMIYFENHDPMWKNKLPELKFFEYYNSHKIQDGYVLYENEKKNTNFEFPLTIFDLLHSTPTAYIFADFNKNSKYELFTFGSFNTEEVILDVFDEARNQMNNLLILFLNSQYMNEENKTIIQNTSEIPLLNYKITTSFETDLVIPLMFNEKKHGEIRMHMQLYNIPISRQFHYGIFTDKGVRINEFSLLNYVNVSKNSLSIFSNIHHKFLEEYENLNKTEEKLSLNKKIRISGTLDEIKDLLEETISDFILYYKYENVEELFEAEEIILKIGLKILEIIDKIGEEEQMTALEILKLIICRAEFDQTLISEIWFILNIESKKEYYKKIIEKKKLVTIFIDFLINNLEMIEKTKNIPLFKNYINTLFVNFYFKFPLIRNYVIQNLLKNVPEKFFGKLSVNKKDFITYPENNILFFDVPNEEKLKKAKEKQSEEFKNLIESYEKKIKNILDNSSYFLEIKKKEEFAFNFILEIVEFIEKRLLKNFSHMTYIHWSRIYGMVDILNSIIYQVSKMETDDIPESFKNLLFSFLNEPKVYKSILNSLLLKTNAYDSNSVFYILDLFDACLQEYNNTFPKAELDIDYNFLYKAFYIIMKTDNSMSISKFLWLYYKDSHLMKSFHLIEVIINIIKPNFYIFFFSWSQKIRRVFHYLLIYILYYRLNSKLKYRSLIKEKNNLANKKEFSEYFYEEKQKINSLLKIFAENNFYFDHKKYENLIKDILPKQNFPYVHYCLEEYVKIQSDFDVWKNDYINNKVRDYPIINISPPSENIDGIEIK